MEVSDWFFQTIKKAGDYMYTEDNVLIYKVFVHFIPCTTTNAKIESYFSKYGAIEEIRFVNRGCCCKSAFIWFENAADAAKVLLPSVHYIYSVSPSQVLPCYSWMQPIKISMKANVLDTKTLNINKKDNCKNCNDSSSLDIDCLEIVLKRLKLREQIRFVRSFRSALPLFECLFKNERTLLLEKLNNCTLWDFYDFFQLVGKFFTRIEGELHVKYRERIIDYIMIYCTHITEVSLIYSEVSAESFHKLLEVGNIVDLRLANCKLSDDYVIKLKKLRHLKRLDLTHNDQLTGLHLSKLSNTMEVLNLNNCTNILPLQIIEFCKKLYNLKEVSFKDCNQALFSDSRVLHEMQISCKRLTCVKVQIRNDEELELVAQLPYLKRLVVFTAPIDLASYLSTLIRHKADQLEYLHFACLNCIEENTAERISRLKSLRTLVCPKNAYLSDRALLHFEELKNLEEIVLDRCNQISNSGVIRLVLSCSKLKFVHIQRCCLITDQLIIDLIKQMKTQQQQQQQLENEPSKQRKQPVLLMVHKTMINESILELPEYKNAKNLLKIYFEDLPQKYDELDEYFSMDDLYPFDEDLLQNNQYENDIED